jgi:hypothetical protein
MFLSKCIRHTFFSVLLCFWLTSLALPFVVILACCYASALDAGSLLSLLRLPLSLMTVYIPHLVAVWYANAIMHFMILSNAICMLLVIGFLMGSHLLAVAILVPSLALLSRTSPNFAHK